MTHPRPPHRRARFAIAASAAAVLVVVAAVTAAGFIAGPQPPVAQASNHLCGTSHDALDTQELEFLELLEDWRGDNGRVPADLEPSTALNAAAAWFSQHLVEEGPASFVDGHLDHLDRGWQERAQDCGYAGAYQPLQYGSGEGIGFIQGSSPLQIGPDEALDLVTYPGSGVNISQGGSLPAKCVGVGRFASGDGRTHAWIVVIAQYSAGQSCPGSTASPPPTATPTASPTPQPTEPPTQMPTPSPTPTLEPTATPEPTQGPATAGHHVPALSRDVGW